MAGADPVDPKRVEALLNATFEHEQRVPIPITVEFVDTETITELNAVHRDRPRATDVLSFPFDESFPQGSGGQVIVCEAEAARGAGELGRPLPEHLDRLIVHGALHVLGYKDETPEQLAKMERRTDAIVKRVHG